MNLKKTIECINALSEHSLEMLRLLLVKYENIILIGNGGSNSIASHIAVDYVKFLNKKAFAFSDPAMLTAYMNDYGVEAAYSQYIFDMASDDTLVILISSSGNSQNIYNAANYCNNNSIDYVLLTGFKSDNKVRKDFGNQAALDVWIDSSSYGVVECVHQIFLHAVVDN